MEQRQTISDDLKPSRIDVVHWQQVQIPDHHIRCHPRASFTTHASSCALQCKPSTSQHPSLCATCSVVAKDIKETATPAGTRGRREREPEAPKKQHTESRRINPRRGRRGEARERNTRQRATLRSEHRLFRGRESWPDTALHFQTVDWNCGSALPPMSWDPWFSVHFHHRLMRTDAICQRCPTWFLKPSSFQVCSRVGPPSKWNAGWRSFRACTMRADTAGCLIPRQSAQTRPESWL